jgi:creatinine amidohydrolase
MRFDDLNWMDLQGYLAGEDRLMLVLGACEQHGYLSLMTDVQIPMALADSAGEQTGILLAPPVNFGCSPYFLSFPGTISLRVSTFLDLVEDIIRSIYRYGFRRILILNGHGGNDAARIRLYELLNSFPDLKISWYSWWTAGSVIQVAEKYGLKPAHANWLEAFPFTKVADLPAQIKIPPHIPGLLSADDAIKVYQDGSFGGQYEVEKQVMDEIFQTALQDILQLLKFE